MPARVEAVAAAEREPRHANGRTGSVHDGASALRERRDQLDLPQPRAGQHAPVGEYLDAAQSPQVEHDAARDGGGADVAVAACAHAHGELARARDAQGGGEVARVERLRNRRGVHAVVAAVEDGPDALVGGRAGPEHGAAHGRGQRDQRRRRAPAPRQRDGGAAEQHLRPREARHGLHGGMPILRRMSEVAALEDLCERAWPPRERLALESLVLRFADGFTRRANSARVDAGGGDLDDLITRAEHEYRSRGLRPGFRLTPLTPPAFEPLLRERGYVVDTEAIVMVADDAASGDLGATRRRHRARAGARRRVAGGLQGSRAQLAARAGPGRALGARIRDRAAALRARARRRRAGGHRLRPPRGRLALHRVRRRRSRSAAGSASRAPSASGSSHGPQPAARDVRSCRRRRKTPRRRGFTHNSGSAPATSIATSSPGTD